MGRSEEVPACEGDDFAGRAWVVAVVGPSGVGKDSVMRALAARHGFRQVRRVITRPAAAGGEAFESCDMATFERAVAAGRFALHWHAHGMRYGVPHSELSGLGRDRVAVVNLSRQVLQQANDLWPGFVVVNLRAAPEILAQRLRARGREDAAAIARRLSRRVALPAGLSVIDLWNEGPLEETVATLIARLNAGRLG